MTSTASLKNIPISPIKLSAVAALVRGEKVDDAIAMLTHLNKKGAKYIVKLLKSAASNVADQYDVESENLIIKTLYVTQGPSKVFRRYRFAARGRVKPYKKYRSNLFVTVTDGE